MITVQNLVAELQEQQVELVVGGLAVKDASTGSWSISGPGGSFSDLFPA